MDLKVLLYSDLLSGRTGGPVAAGWNREVGFSWLIDVKVVECVGGRGTYIAVFCAV